MASSSSYQTPANQPMRAESLMSVAPKPQSSAVTGAMAAQDLSVRPPLSIKPATTTPYKPTVPVKSTVSPAQAIAKEVYGDKPVEYTSTAKQMVDLNDAHARIQKQISDLETASKKTPIKSGQGTSVMGGGLTPTPAPTFLQTQRDTLVKQLYETEKTMNDLGSKMNDDDYASINNAASYYEKLSAAEKQKADEYQKVVQAKPGKAAAFETGVAVIGQGLKLFGILPRVLSEYEKRKEGRTPLQQEIVLAARKQGPKLETVAGNVSNHLAEFGRIGAEYWLTGQALAAVPGVSGVLGDTSVAIKGGTATLARTTTQRLAGGALMGATHAGIVQGIQGEFHPDQVLAEAATMAVFEGFVAPMLGKVWRKMTTTNEGEVTFMARPNGQQLPNGNMLPGGAAPSSWLPKTVQEVWMNNKIGATGVTRRMIFSMDDGNIFEMRWTPDGLGNAAVQITKDAPNWLKLGAMDLLHKFDGKDPKGNVIDVKARDARVSYSEGSNGEPTVMQPTRSAAKPMAKDQYFYHTTPSANQDSIAINGLTPKDGKVYVAEIPEGARLLGMKFGQNDAPNDLLLRVNKEGIAQIWGDQRTTAMSWYTNKGIDPKFIEAQINGQWVPVNLLHTTLPKSLPPVVVDIPASPMPEVKTDFTTIGLMSVKNFMGGRFYTAYKPQTNVTGKESRLTGFASKVPPATSGGESLPKKEEAKPAIVPKTPVAKEPTVLPAQTLKALKNLTDVPAIAEVHEELTGRTKILQDAVSGMEKLMTDLNPPKPEDETLIGVAENIRRALATSPQLPNGVSRTQFFQDLASNGDSVKSITERLNTLLEQSKSATVRNSLNDIVRNLSATGKLDDIEDFTAFQNAIVSGRPQVEDVTKMDLLTRASRVIDQIGAGDMIVEDGKTLHDLLDEIDLLEYQLNEQIVTHSRGKQPERKTAKQTQASFGKSITGVQGQSTKGERITLVPGRVLVNAVLQVSKEKGKEFKIKLREAVARAVSAQREKSTEKYTAAKSDVQAIKAELIKELKDKLPLEKRGKFLATVKNVATRKQLEKALDRADNVVEDIKRKEAMDRFKKMASVKVKELRPEYQQPVQEILESFNPTNTSGNKLVRLIRLAEFLGREPENQVPQSVIEELKVLSQKRMADMTTEEINQIADALAHLIHLNNVKNKLLIRGKLRDAATYLAEAKANVTASARAKNGDLTGLDFRESEDQPGILKNIFTVDSYNAELKGEILDGSSNGIIKRLVYDGIDDGVTKQLAFEQNAEDFFKDRLEGIDMSRWSGSFQKKAKNVDVVTVPISGGRTLHMSKGQRVAFLLHRLHAQNAKHILEGGFSFANTPSKIIKINEEDFKAIEKSATQEEFTVAGAMNEYLNTIQKHAINDVSVDLLGYEIARVQNYFPIRTNHLDRFHDDLIKQGKWMQATIEGMGFTKERINASNAIIIDDAFAAVYKTIKNAGSYVGLAAPLRSAKMLLNDNAFEMAAIAAGRKNYLDSLRDYIKEVEGAEITKSDSFDKLGHGIFEKIAVAYLGLNPWTMLKQPISFMNAATEMDIKYLKKAALTIPTKEDVAEMRAASPQLRDRMEGHVTRETGEIADVGAAKKFFTGKSAFSQRFTAGLENFDRKAIVRIWNAVKAEVKARNPDLTGDEYWEAVRRRADLVVRRTQSTSHVKDRPNFAMKKDLLRRGVTLFTSERNKAYMQVRRAGERYNRSEKTAKDKAKFMKTLVTVLLITPLMAVGIDRLRDKAYKRDKAHSWLSTALDVIAMDLGAFYILGDEFNSLRSKVTNGTFSGYDTTNPLIDVQNQMIDSLAGAIRSVTFAISGEKYKSGANKGEAKWKVEAQNFMGDALKTIALFKGLPQSPISIFQAAARWLNEPTKKKKATASSSRSTNQRGGASSTR